MKKFFTLILLAASLCTYAQNGILGQASDALRKKNWKEASQLFKTYRVNNPSDAGSLANIAFSEMKLGNYKIAINYADSVFLLTSQPNSLGQARLVLSRCYAALNDKTKALQYLEEAAATGINFYGGLKDTLFSSIRNEERFKRITEQFKINSSPCEFDERYTRLNFLVGIWDVYIGKNFESKVAVDTITHGPGDCAIFENFVWTSGGNYKGRSMTFFDPSTQKFRMCWTGTTADIRNFEEIKSETNVMQLLAITNVPGNQMVHRRMTLTYNPSDGSVHQFIENSFNFGRTWETAFDAMFKKAK